MLNAMSHCQPLGRVALLPRVLLQKSGRKIWRGSHMIVPFDRFLSSRVKREAGENMLGLLPACKMGLISVT
jgi:hypothetical protein